jgi:hypothetical protein
VAFKLHMPVAEAKHRISEAELVEWLAWFELEAEIAEDGPEALDRYQEGADAILAHMDAELERIAREKMT